MSGVTEPAVDVVALLERAEFRGLPLRVSILTVLAMVFDGFDVQAIAFAAPALLPEFGITRPQLGPILAAGLVGMAIGAFLLGSLGDRFGRRTALIASLLLVAASSLGTALAHSPGEIVAWRLLTGIGLGGAVPNCTALMMEFAPLRVRNVVVALTIVGVPIGGMLGAEVAVQILPLFGWRAIFVIGCALPGLLVLVLFFALPESPRYLARLGNQNAKLAAMLNQITRRRDIRADLPFTVHEPQIAAAKSGWVAVLNQDYRRDTLLIWLIFATNIFAVYAFFSWLPTVLSSIGLPMAIALRGALIFNLGGVVASLLLSTAISAFGSRSTLRVVGAGAILVTAAIGLIPAHNVAAMLMLIALAGACIIAVQVFMFAVAAHAYPTELRSTGVGWASTVGRAGGITSSLAGGLLLTLGNGAWSFFVAIAVVLVPMLLGVWLLKTHLPATSHIAK